MLRPECNRNGSDPLRAAAGRAARRVNARRGRIEENAGNFRSDLLRQRPWLTVRFGEHGVRFRVVRKGLRLRIELQDPADPVCDLGQVNDAAAEMGHLGGSIRWLPGFDGFQEVGHVGFRVLAELPSRDARPLLLLAAHVDLEVAPAGKDHVPLRPVEGVAVVVSVEPIGRPQPVFVEQHLPFGVLESYGHVVRILPFPLQVDGAAVGRDPHRMGRHTEGPARHVDVVGAVVPHVSVAIVPVDAPTPVEAIGVEGALGRRSQPPVIVHAVGDGTVRLGLQGVAALDIPGLGHLDLAHQT